MDVPQGENHKKKKGLTKKLLKVGVGLKTISFPGRKTESLGNIKLVICQSIQFM